MKKIITFLLIFAMIACKASASADGNKISIIPQPQLVTTVDGAGLTIDSGTIIVAQGCEEANSAGFLNDYLKRYYGFELKVVGELKPAQTKNHTDRKSTRLNSSH